MNSFTWYKKYNAVLKIIFLLLSKEKLTIILKKPYRGFYEYI